MTAELADVSVGAAEGVEGWNTLIVRSDRGADLVDAARAAGIIEVDAPPDENLNHLKGASLGKRRRAFANISGMTGSENDLLYLDISDDLRRRLVED
jgi:coenzyme F420 hydrogenase subunit beta